MEAFDQEQLRQFGRRLQDMLEPAAPPGTNLQALIDRGIADARRFHLVTERDTARFVQITCRELGGFPDGPLPVPALAVLM